MEAIRDGRLPGPPIARHLGYSVHSVGPGRVSFRGTPTADVLNPMGTVHGGWYGTLLDSAMGCAVMTMLPSGIAYTTLEYKVNVVRALRIGIEIEAVGEVQHVGRSTGVASGEIRDARGPPLRHRLDHLPHPARLTRPDHARPPARSPEPPSRMPKKGGAAVAVKDRHDRRPPARTHVRVLDRGRRLSQAAGAMAGPGNARSAFPGGSGAAPDGRAGARCPGADVPPLRPKARRRCARAAGARAPRRARIPTGPARPTRRRRARNSLPHPRIVPTEGASGSVGNRPAPARRQGEPAGLARSSIQTSGMFDSGRAVGKAAQLPAHVAVRAAKPHLLDIDARPVRACVSHRTGAKAERVSSSASAW